jgi:CHAT domain-containing protein
MVGSRWGGLVLSCAVGLAQMSGSQTNDEGRNDLLIASLQGVLSKRPPLEGRLSRDLQGLPQPEKRTQETFPLGAATLIRGAQYSLPPDSSSAKALYTQGLLELAYGHSTTAVSLLEEAVDARPHDAAVINDLAVAYLDRYQREDSPLDLLFALSAVNRALSLEPLLVQGLFNRARILTRLHLRHRAEIAWDEYLGADLGTPWKEDAQQELRSVTEPSLAELWEQELSRLVRAADHGDQTTTREIVSRFPHLARVEAEEKALPAWGEALASGDRAAASRQLNLTRAVGAALLTVTGDAMLSDVASQIDDATKHGSVANLERLAVAYRSFGRGLRLYRNQEGTAAQPLLAESALLLHSEGSPFAGWAQFYTTTCTHYADSTSALREFLLLDAATDSRRHSTLAGLTAWMEGTLQNNLNQPERALTSFHLAGERLAKTAAPETSGFIHVLRAETYERLGEVNQAWRERILALQAAARGGDRRRAHSTLHEAANAAQRINPSLALDLIAELLENDRAWGNPGAFTEAALLSGRILSRLGRYHEALDSFRIAQSSAVTVGKGPQSDHIATEIALAEGEVLVSADPRRAIGSLTAALESAEKRKFLLPVTRLLAIRGRAYQALEDWNSAEADFRQAILEHEQIRGNLKDEKFRISYFESAQTVFDAMINLQAESRHDPEEAFNYAERARARLLLDLTANASASIFSHPLTARDVLAHLFDDVALIEYAVLTDRLIAWTAFRGRLEMAEIPMTEAEADRQIHALSAALKRRAPELEIRRAASSLYESLLRPILKGLPAGIPLIVVPDRSLVQIPFAALFDEQHKRYLVEDRTVVLAPSATLYFTATKRARAFRDIPWTALVVGDPAFDRSRHPLLSRLPQAAEEAAYIAALYRNSVLLGSEAATRESFLAALGTHRVVHFAGHALLNPGQAPLNRLLFAPGTGSDSLSAAEITGLHLHNTQIVVLSACRTVPGGRDREEMNGLAAAFLAAGAPVVVSSLWNTEDRATHALMLSFHKALRVGDDAASALRKAQLELLYAHDETLRSSAAWGGFEAIGGAITE